MALAVLLLIPVIVDLVRRPTFRRFAFRNVVRRKGEAVLVVIGAMLGTAIITASMIVGTTITAAVRDGARTELGPVDEVVRAADANAAADVARRVTASPIPGTDGTLQITTSGAVVATVGSDRRADVHGGLIEVDFDAARGFGDDPVATGLAAAGATPTGDEAVLSNRLADHLGVRVGDQVEAFAQGSSRRFTVRDIVDRVGLVGYLPTEQIGFDRATPSPMLVPRGTIASMLAAGSGATAQPGAAAAGAPVAPPKVDLVISNTGDLFTGVERTDAVVTEIKARLGPDSSAEVLDAKRDLLDAAKASGDSISQLYSTIGGFSVVAGILLLVNLFVMLAEERKIELGMLRAVGFKRNHLVRTFAIEGALYSVSAAILGGFVGIGVGYIISRIASGIVSRGDEGLVYRLSAPPGTVLAGMGAGLLISMLTVWGTSVRIARLNVIRAIRDLPEPQKAGGRARLLVGGAGVVLGGLLLARGIAGPAAVPTVLGPAIALFSLIPLLERFTKRRLLLAVVSVLVLVWGIGVFTFLPDVMGRPGPEVFLAQGIVLVAAAVMLLSTLDLVWARAASVLAGGGTALAARLGLAYPLARKFRTSMLFGMFAIVIFTMTFISVFGAVFTKQAPSMANDMRAGYDLFVDSNPANPLTADQLRAQPGVEDASMLTGGLTLFTTQRRTTPQGWRLSGIDESFVRYGTPTLAKRLPEYRDDRAAYDAVLADPSKAIVPSFFLQRGGGPPANRVEPGETVNVVDPVTRAVRPLTVAAIVDNDWTFNGVVVNKEAAAALLGQRASASRAYVRVTPGTDAATVATQLTGTFVENGASAQTFASRVENILAVQLSFFSLMDGYLGLGLLIGIAGLGVVMVRAVRERRRQIGMLRAMGFPSRVVRRAFMLEAAFIALQGILVGVALGLLTSYQLLVNSSTFGDQDLDFAFPWVVMAITVVVPLLASLLATAAPAQQASRIRPAVALRIAD